MSLLRYPLPHPQQPTPPSHSRVIGPPKTGGAVFLTGTASIGSAGRATLSGAVSFTGRASITASSSGPVQGVYGPPGHFSAWLPVQPGYLQPGQSPSWAAGLVTAVGGITTAAQGVLFEALTGTASIGSSARATIVTALTATGWANSTSYATLSEALIGTGPATSTDFGSLSDTLTATGWANSISYATLSEALIGTGWSSASAQASLQSLLTGIGRATSADYGSLSDALTGTGAATTTGQGVLQLSGTTGTGWATTRANATLTMSMTSTAWATSAGQATLTTTLSGTGAGYAGSYGPLGLGIYLEGATTASLAPNGTYPVTLPVTTKVNDCIVVWMSQAGTGTPSVSGAGATWDTAIAEAPFAPGCFCFVGYGATAGATTISVTLSGTTMGLLVSVWSGVSPLSPVLSGTANTSSGTVESTWTVPSGSYSSGDLVMACVASFSVTTWSATTWSNGGTTASLGVITGSTGTRSVAADYILPAGTGSTTATYTWVPSTANDVNAGIVVLSPVATGVVALNGADGCVSTANATLSIAAAIGGTGAVSSSSYASLSLSVAVTGTAPATSASYGTLSIAVALVAIGQATSSGRAVLPSSVFVPPGQFSAWLPVQPGYLQPGRAPVRVVNFQCNASAGSHAYAILTVIGFVFTPPVLFDGASVAYWDRKFEEESVQEWAVKDTNPKGFRLMSFYKQRPVGVAIYKMSDGTYASDRPIPGLHLGSVPYPTVPIDQQVNGVISMSYSGYEPGVVVSEQVQSPSVVTVYNGGTSYPVSQAEALALTAAGLGAYVT